MLQILEKEREHIPVLMAWRLHQLLLVGGWGGGGPSVAPAGGGVPPCSTSAAPPAVALVLEEQRGQIAVVQATPAEEKALTVGRTGPVERASTRNTCTGLQDSQAVCYGHYWA